MSSIESFLPFSTSPEWVMIFFRRLSQCSPSAAPFLFRQFPLRRTTVQDRQDCGTCIENRDWLSIHDCFLFYLHFHPPASSPLLCASRKSGGDLGDRHRICILAPASEHITTSAGSPSHGRAEKRYSSPTSIPSSTSPHSGEGKASRWRSKCGSEYLRRGPF